MARQNGKNGALEAVELYGMVVLGLKFLHTAHEVSHAVEPDTIQEAAVVA